MVHDILGRRREEQKETTEYRKEIKKLKEQQRNSLHFSRLGFFNAPEILQPVF
jgi:hypothetical protein